MRPMVELYNKWAYGSADKAFFAEHREPLCESNISTLIRLSAIVLLLLIMYLFSASFVVKASSLAIVYMTLGAVNIASLVFGILAKKMKFSYRLIHVVLISYLLATLIAGIFIGVVCNTDVVAAMFLIILFGGQLLFLFPPKTTFFVSLTGCVLLIVATFSMKSFKLAVADTLNSVGALILGAYVCWNNMSMRVVDQKINDKLERLSTTDELTGLMNRRQFNLTYNTMFENCKRRGDSLAVVMTDLDAFKTYNDNYGHIAGDECLSKIGIAFSLLSTQSGWQLARFGGEEFAAVLPGVDLDTAVAFCEALQRSVMELGICNDFSPVSDSVTISAGLYYGCVGDDSNAVDFINKADEALYSAKRDGRNCLRVLKQSDRQN